MKKLVGATVVGMFLAAGLGVAATNNTVLAQGAISLSGTVTGTGEIVGETFLANFNVGVFEILETQNFSGSITGTRSQALTERAAFNLNTNKGTYFAIFNFDGSIAGTPCTGVIVEHGDADLAAGTFSGKWEFLYNDCGFSKVMGTFHATATFTSQTTYDIAATYNGTAK